MPKACAEGGLSVHGPTPCGARRFRAGMDGSVGRSLENPWSLSGGALSLRPSFFSLFSPEQQENQGRRRILDCVSGVSLREKCQSLMHTGARRENLVAANFGRILQSGLFGVAAPISDAFAHAFCRRPPEVEDGQPPVFGCVGAK